MAREHPRYAEMEFPEYSFEEFPKMIYPGATDAKKPYYSAKGKRIHGRPLPGVLVNNEEEERQAMNLPPEPEDDEPLDDDEAPEEARHLAQHDRVQAGQQLKTTSPGVTRLATEKDERTLLIEEAETKGVSIDKRWSIAKIQDAIDSAEVV